MLSGPASASVTGLRTSVLIADDEPLARRRLRALLAKHGDFEVIAECADGVEALASLHALKPDVAFIDIQMPGSDGMTVIRSLGSARPPIIVFVTAFDEYAVDAFAVRAVDYVLKPFDEERFNETLLRVREQLQTARMIAQPEVVQIGQLEIDMGARRVRLAGRPVLLRRKEFDVLARLAKQRGNVLTRRELLDDVWGYKVDVVSRTLDTHVCELRRKLAIESKQPGFIETIARVGYRMKSEKER